MLYNYDISESISVTVNFPTFRRRPTDSRTTLIGRRTTGSGRAGGLGPMGSGCSYHWLVIDGDGRLMIE